MKIALASFNAHKISEFARMFERLGGNFELSGAGSFAGYTPPAESGKSFKENALIKARALRPFAGKSYIVAADDSGIEVDALGGAPGVFSARYAGAEGKDADALNNKKLLSQMEGVDDKKRSARFVCVLAVIFPDGSEKTFRGEMEGFIAHEERGKNGFGYDPLFYLPEFGATSAELPPETKNLISHRAKALGKLAIYLENKENT